MKKQKKLCALIGKWYSKDSWNKAVKDYFSMSSAKRKQQSIVEFDNCYMIVGNSAITAIEDASIIHRFRSKNYEK